MTKQPNLLIQHAIVALGSIRGFLADRSMQQYLEDPQCQAAIERQIEIAGEALERLHKLDPALFIRIPGAGLIVAFRNVLAHGCASSDQRRVYDLAARKVPPLQAVLQQMRGNLAEEGAKEG